MADLVRRFHCRRDAQGNVHTLAEDIRMSSLEALLPDDLEKHVQLNRARLTSYGVLREEIRTYYECRGHKTRQNTKQKGSSFQEEMTQWTSLRLAKARVNKAMASMARAKAKGCKDKDSKDKSKDKISGKRGPYSKDCWSKKDNKGGSKGKHKAKNAMDAHNLDSTKPAQVKPEVEIGGLDMNYFDADAFEMQEPDRIKIGVDTDAGKTAWPHRVPYGKTIPGNSVTLLSAQQLVN